MPVYKHVRRLSFPSILGSQGDHHLGKGVPWAAGMSARTARRHKRTRSGRVVAVPEGQLIPPDQAVTVGEVEALVGREEAVDERTALLAGVEDGAAGGGNERATD